MKRKKVTNLLLNLLVLAILVVSLFPFYIMITTAFKTDQGAVAYPPQLWPSEFTLEHFFNVMNPDIFPFWRYFGNSFFIAFVTAAVSCVICIMASYSFARLNFWGKKFFNNVTLIVYMFSGILLIVPLFRIFSSIGLIDNRLSVIIACLVTTMPAGLSMLTSYFQSLPDSVEEAAMMDGLNRVQVIFKIVVPLSIPGIMSVFSYVFMNTWNNFLYVATFLNSYEKMTLIIGMRNLFSSQDYVWGRMMMASILTAIPVILIFAVVEKFMKGGLTSGAVKG